MKAKKLEKVLNKKVSRRAASTLIALAMLINETYIWSVIDEGSDKNTPISPLTATAEEGDPVFDNYDDETLKKISVNIEDFVDYSVDCQNFPTFHKDDKITIKSTDKTDFFMYGFAGLGTEEVPFNGSIEISAGNTIPLNLDAPLFNCVNDNVTLGSAEKPLKISRYYESGAGADETMPLIAKKIANVDGTATWNIDVVSPSDSSSHLLADFGGFIGSMNAGTEVALTVIMNTSESDTEGVAISGSSDCGLACGHMGAGAKLTFSISNTRAISGISTTSGDVGSLVGEMETNAQFVYSGGNFLADASPISTSGGEYGGYAGGIVGKNIGGTVILGTSPYTINQYITGTEGAGGVYGYYQPVAALISTTVKNEESGEDETTDNIFYTTNYDIDCCVNGNGNTGGLFGMLDTTYDVTIKGDGIGDSDSAVKAAHYSGDAQTVFGGLIGQYKADDVDRTLTIENVKVTPSRGGTAKYYGGCIGRMDPSTPTYAKFTDVKVNASNAGSLTFGGLVACADQAFVNANGVNITASGYKGGGLVGRLENGVLQISGSNTINSASSTPGSGEEKKVGKIVGYRDNGLVFVDKENSTCTTQTASVDDIGAWGGVLKLSAFDYPDKVLTVSDHEVIIGIDDYEFTSIGSAEQFAVTALRFQIDGTESTATDDDNNTIITGNPFVTFADDTLTSSTIVSEDIELSSAVSLAGTGIYGLTRDNDVSLDGSMEKCVYEGVFDGGSKTITFDTGTIYRHKYVGLFAKLNGGTVQKVTFNGKIDVDAQSTMYVGAAAATATGNFKTSQVTISGGLKDNDDPFISFAGDSTLYLGGILGEADEDIGSIDILNSSISAKIIGENQNAVVGGVIGQISHTADEKREWKFDTVNLKGTVQNTASVEDATIGGLIAVIADSSGYSEHRTVTLKAVNPVSLTVSGTGSASMGGLLGYSWLKTDVDLQSVTASTSIVENSDTGSMAGLVYRATGKWDVSSLTEGVTISASGAPSVGMIVNKGISKDTSYDSAIYLCLKDGYTYDLSGANVSSVTAGVFDEICAYTASDSNKVLENGNGIISIASTFKTNGTDSSGSYHAQTSKGASANPNSRYYYNLDSITDYAEKLAAYNAYDALSDTEKAAYEGTPPTAPTALGDAEQLLSWGVNQYACKNLKQYFADPFGNTITAGKNYDMTNYSWYPVDLDKSITVNGTFKFTCHEFESSEDVKKENETENAYDRTNMSQNQHYTMHCGLFRNVASGKTLTVGTSAFQGDVGIINGGSGALVYGKVEGASPTSKATVKINGPLSLDGIYVYGVNSETVNGKTVWNYAPLLINQVGNYVNLNVSGVKTTSAYTSGQKASSLIGDVGLSDAPTGITVDFRNIKLDGRETVLSESGTTYNDQLDTIYGTTSSIFTRATLLNSFRYASGSTGTYNFKRSDDWAESIVQDPAYPDDPTKTITTYTHNGKGVTYGEELGYDSTNYPKTGSVAFPKHNSQYPDEEFMYEAESGSNTRTYFTNPVNALDTGIAVGDKLEGAYKTDFISGFIPYVYKAYDPANNYYQLQVNHGPSAATGCGTYDDPYVLASGDKLEDFCKWINTPVVTSGSTVTSGFTNADTICVPASELSDSAITGTWCGDDHVLMTYDGSKFTGTKGSTTYTITPDTMRTYLAGAYYQIPDSAPSITIDDGEKFTGLGNTTDEYAKFRGVIDGNGRTIINKTGSPLIESSNGSVVKDVTIIVQPTNGISLINNGTYVKDAEGNDTTTKTSEVFAGDTSGNRAYGAVIGKTFGGDNIIDGVSVSFGTEATADAAAVPANITISGTYAQFAPVGSYVGVVINGGLYFRNMNRLDNNSNPLTYGENLFSNVTFSANANSAVNTKPYKANNKEWLYVNPIIGRVINGFAVTESGVTANGGISYTEAPAYRPFEDGTRQYPDETDDTDETWAAGHVTMQNGTKNYSITDINPQLADFTMMKDNAVSGAEGATVTVSNAQQLFIISLITEAGLGTSSNCKYDNTHNRLKPYGAYRATHIAHYTKIGAEGLTSADSDYQIAKNDVQTSEDYTTKIPHIIKEYTPSKSATEYPAFDLAAFEANENELYLDMVFSNESGSDEEYMMPDGFRGLGALLLGEAYWTINADGTSGTTGNDDANYRWLLNTMNVNSLTGNDRIISLNMNLELYSDDNYNFPGNSTDANLKTGFGFFNALRSNYDSEAENKIQGLTIKGTVNYDTISKSTGEHLEISAQNTYVRPAVGGFIGAPGVDTNKDGGGGDMWLEDITLDNLSVSGVLYAGGMIGCSNVGTTGKIKTYTFINCSADNLEVTGGTSAGGMIGYIRNSCSNTYCDFGGKEFGVISIVSRATGADEKNGAIAAGALIGDNHSSQNAVGSGLTVKNVIIKSATSVTKGYVGYSEISANTGKVKAGGVLGTASRNSRIDMSNVEVNNIDVKAWYSGGVIGSVAKNDGSGNMPVSITDCKVITDKNAVIENMASNGMSGGLIGLWQSEGADYGLTVKNIEVNGYTVKGDKNCGGLVGRKLSANLLECDNITVDSVSISTNEKGGGLVGDMSNGSMNGYNILVTGLSFGRYSGAGNVATWGYIAGRNENKDIKLAGFSRQGTISTAKTIGTYATNMYGANGYVVFADYDDKGTSVSNAKFSNVLTSGANIGYNGIGSTTTKSVSLYVTQTVDGETEIVHGPIPYGDVVTETGDFDSDIGNTAQSTVIGKVVSYKSFEGFYLYYKLNGTTPKYFSSTVNGKGALVEKDSTADAAKWYFEEVGTNLYKIFTIVGGEKKYIHTKNGNQIELSSTEADTIEKTPAEQSEHGYYLENSYRLKYDSENKWLQHSGNGEGIRYYTSLIDNGKPINEYNSMIKIESAGESNYYTEFYSTSYDSLTVGDTKITVGNVSGSGTPSEAEKTDYTTYCTGLTNAQLYYVTETIKENTFEQIDNPKPYVTTNPKANITSSQFLTGDGVSSTSYLTSAFRHIITDQKNATAKAYTTCSTQLGLAENADTLTAIRSELSTSYNEYRSYISSHANSGLSNFPLLIAEDTDYTKLTPLINNYLQTLTNTDYNFADTAANSSVFNLGLYKCEFKNGAFEVTTEVVNPNTDKACLEARRIGSNYYFYMDAGYVDTKDVPQFTLMDVQFLDPSDTSKVAYHLYVPVYVKKVLRFEFNAEIKSGTDYYQSAYEKVSELRNQGLFENLGNPVTIAFQWKYDRIQQDWIDSINGGDSLLTNYYKSFMLKNNTDNGWSANTKMVLVDANNSDKAYYLDKPPTATDEPSLFNLYDFTDTGASTGEPYKPVDLNDLMTVTFAQADDGMLTIWKEGDTEAATVRAIMAGDETGTLVPLRPITEEELADEENPFSTANRYKVTAVSDVAPEQYYLTIFTKSSNANTVYHYEMYSPDSFGDTHMADASKWRANKINDNKNTVMHLFTGNLYENDLVLSVVPKMPGATDPQLMSDSNDYLTITMTANIRLTETAKLSANNINGNMRDYSKVSSIYQTFLMMYDKLESGSSTSKVGIELEADGKVGNRKYYYKKGVIDGALSEVNLIPNAEHDYGATEADSAENVISDKYIELRNKVDLIDKLADDASGNSITLQVKYNMVYNTADLPVQFSKKVEGSENIGSRVIGYSRIASTVDSAAYSATSQKATDSDRYYTKDESTAKLTYNIVEASLNAVGPYKDLGINPLDSNETEKFVDTYAVYDIQDLKDPGDFIEITFSLSKRSNYNTPLPIDKYLTGLEIYGKDGDDTGSDDDVIFKQGSADVSDANIKTTNANTENSTIYKVRVNKELLKQTDGLYIIPIKFSVKTGSSDFEDDGLEYSNYKATVTAKVYSSMSDTEGSAPSAAPPDHIIYTNAKVATAVVE